MNITLDQLTADMRQKSTDELLDICQTGDPQWSDLALVAVEQVLTERGVAAPAQQKVVVPAPRYEGVKG